MPSENISRRRLLKGGSAAVVTVAGCLTESPSSSSTATSPPWSPTDGTTTAETNVGDESVNVASLSVADFIRYPLAGVHPHVHRRADTQYLIVRISTSRSAETVRNELGCTLDGESVPLADRQPVRWKHATVDTAFAVPKSDTFDGGRILFGGGELRAVSETKIERLNTPPVFEVSNPSASPDEIRSGERSSATVRFDLRNTGDGRGTFGVSLTGNYVSGSNTVTATLDSGAQREITASTEIVGEGEKATVRLDWGSGEWSTRIPVIDTTTTTESSTQTPSQ